MEIAAQSTRAFKGTGENRREMSKIDAFSEADAHKTALYAIYPKNCKIYPCT